MGGTEIIFSVQESPEGGYEARALGFSIYTQADTLDELKAMVQDAVRCHFDPQSGPRFIALTSQEVRGPRRSRLLLPRF
jgi:hypothetical protein